jgi:putative transposase
MPWKKVNAMEDHAQFIVEFSDRCDSFASICRKYGISQETGYKWIQRFKECGCIEERSRAPRACPHKTSEETVRLWLSLRDKNP